MPASLAASLLDFLLVLARAPAGQDPANRFTIEGLALRTGQDGALEIAMRKLEAVSLRMSSGPFVLEVEQLALHDVVATVRVDAGKPRLAALAAASADLSGVKVQAPLAAPAQPEPHVAPAAAATSAWSLAPLAAADGAIQAEIVDAKLVFDADVTVPIRQGLVDFNVATVEHVGPDSRMGVSRLGVYVDAPNGRSYLYQFSSAPVAGVEYERRSPLPGPWGTKRGSLQLQAFGEGLLRQGTTGHTQGITEQARLLFDRTAVKGHVQLGDGRLAAPGVQADVTGRAAGHNVVRLHSQAVGRGVTLDVASLSVRNAVVGAGPSQARCDEITGALVLQLAVEGTQLRAALQAGRMAAKGLRLVLGPAPTPSR